MDIEKFTETARKQAKTCTIHGVVCCAECDAMTDEQRWEIEQQLQKEQLENEQWESNMSNLYTYGDDGFCDGFTNW